MNPAVTVAVNVAILNDCNELLIAKRSPDKPMPGVWEFPGGKLEKGESLQECALREIKEELDVEIRVVEHLGFDMLEYEGKTFELHFFIARMADPDQPLKLCVHTEARWVEYAALGEYDFAARELASVKRLEKRLS